MKWFKHFSDNHEGRSVQNLLDQLGHTGLCYYLLMEICAEKLDKIEGRELEESDCFFQFHHRVVRQKLRISPVNLRRLLDVCAANGLLSFEISGNTVKISMPILLDLLDSHSKKAKLRRDEAAIKSALDKDKDKDKDKEYIRPELAKPTQASTKQTFSFSSVDEIKGKINHEFFDSWKNLYDETFVERELVKSLNWLKANSKKNKKSINGWIQFFSNWFERGWPSYQKNLTTVTASPLNFEIETYLKQQKDMIDRGEA